MGSLVLSLRSLERWRHLAWGIQDGGIMGEEVQAWLSELPNPGDMLAEGHLLSTSWMVAILLSTMHVLASESSPYCYPYIASGRWEHIWDSRELCQVAGDLLPPHSESRRGTQLQHGARSPLLRTREESAYLRRPISPALISPKVVVLTRIWPKDYLPFLGWGVQS